MGARSARRVPFTMKKDILRELREAASHSTLPYRKMKKMYNAIPARDRPAFLTWIRSFNSNNTMTITTTSSHDHFSPPQCKDGGV